MDLNEYSEFLGRADNNLKVISLISVKLIEGMYASLISLKICISLSTYNYIITTTITISIKKECSYEIIVNKCKSSYIC